MIKIILYPNSKGETFTFDKQEVLIGSDPAHADVLISENSVHGFHIKISEEKERFIVTNVANDPFTTLNGLPFGKKTITHTAEIQIDQITIKIEVTPTLTQATPKVENKTEQAAPLTSVLPASPPKISEKELEDIPEDFSEEEAFETIQDEPQTPGKDEPPPELDEVVEKPAPFKLPFLIVTWKVLVGLAFACLIAGTLVGSFFYFRANDKNSQEQKKFAAGLSDIAMAMNYASRHHLAPSKQNWLNTEFIQTNLARVLSPHLHSQAQINDQGQFIKYPYILRVYTNSDVSKFLVIAQPAPHLFQWLVNKTAIVVDSTTMEIRKVNDIKAFNKLLANPNPLEGKNGIAISHLIQNGTTMSLDSLAGNNNLWGFSPPKALSLMRPGSENYIYNAPRYYPFGESLLRRAIDLIQNSGNNEDITLLQDEVHSFDKYKDIILYSSHGMQTALDAQRALAILLPDKAFMVAYLKLGHKGHITSSHLLIDEDHHHQLGLLEQTSLLHREFEVPPFSPSNFQEESTLIQPDEGQIDQKHPLYLKLQALNIERQHILKPISNELITLISQNTAAINPEFSQKCQQLLTNYETADTEIQDKLKDKLTELYEEHSEMPLQQFALYIRSGGFSPFVKNNLKNRLESNDTSNISDYDMDDLFQKIQLATDLIELENGVAQIAPELNIGKLPDHKKLIVFQNRLHAEVLNKLAQFLLSPDKNIAAKEISDEDQARLNRIIKLSWITNTDEIDFLITEFEYLRSTKQL